MEWLWIVLIKNFSVVLEGTPTKILTSNTLKRSIAVRVTSVPIPTALPTTFPRPDISLPTRNKTSTVTTGAGNTDLNITQSCPPVTSILILFETTCRTGWRSF